MTTPGEQGLISAVEKARRYLPEIEPESRETSDTVDRAVRGAVAAVDREDIPRETREAVTELTSEAAVLAAMTREAFDEPQLDRADIEAIKDFIKWILNGAVRRR